MRVRENRSVVVIVSALAATLWCIQSASAGDGNSKEPFVRLQQSAEGSLQAGNTRISGSSSAASFIVNSPSGGIQFGDGSVLKSATGTGGGSGSQGPKGDKGDKGDPGERGERGDKGDPGEKGDTGAQGPAGTSGGGAEMHAGSGQGFNMGSDPAFASNVLVLAVEGPGDKFLVNASASHYLQGTAGSTASTVATYYVGLRPAGSSQLEQFGSMSFATFWPRPDNSYRFDTKTMSLSAVITNLPAGSYEVGLVGSSTDEPLQALSGSVTVLKTK